MNVTVEDALNMMEAGYRLEISGGTIGNFVPEGKEIAPLETLASSGAIQ